MNESTHIATLTFTAAAAASQSDVQGPRSTADTDGEDGRQMCTFECGGVTYTHHALSPRHAIVTRLHTVVDDHIFDVTQADADAMEVIRNMLDDTGGSGGGGGGGRERKTSGGTCATRTDRVEIVSDAIPIHHEKVTAARLAKVLEFVRHYQAHPMPASVSETPEDVRARNGGRPSSKVRPIEHDDFVVALFGRELVSPPAAAWVPVGEDGRAVVDSAYLKSRKDVCAVTDIMLVATYLHVPALVNVAAKILAGWMVGLTPEQIRLQFDMSDGPDEGELASVRREFGWVPLSHGEPDTDATATAESESG